MKHFLKFMKFQDCVIQVRSMKVQKWIIFNVALTFDGLCFGPQKNISCIHLKYTAAHFGTKRWCGNWCEYIKQLGASTIQNSEENLSQ